MSTLGSLRVTVQAGRWPCFRESRSILRVLSVIANVRPSYALVMARLNSGTIAWTMTSMTRVASQPTSPDRAAPSGVGEVGQAAKRSASKSLNQPQVLDAVGLFGMSSESPR